MKLNGNSLMSDVSRCLREMGYSLADAARACRMHYEIVRWFHDELPADDIACIIDQHMRGGLEVEMEVEDAPR